MTAGRSPATPKLPPAHMCRREVRCPGSSLRGARLYAGGVRSARFTPTPDRIRYQHRLISTPPAGPGPAHLLDELNVCSLWSLGAFGDLEFHTIAVLKNLGTRGLALVNKYVLTPIGRSNEPESLGCIEPFHRTLHGRSPF